MNATFYLFGKLSQGYTQYPDDYARQIFEHYIPIDTDKTRLVIHRHGELMYYIYVRPLDLDIQKDARQRAASLGMCILLNGVMFTAIRKLYRLFEEIFSSIMLQGVIIGLDNTGHEEARITHFNEKTPEVERITRLLRQGMESWSDSFAKLPSPSYGISTDEVKQLSLDCPESELVNMAHQYSHTVIYPDGKDVSDALSGYKTIVKQLNEEKEELNRRYDALVKQYIKIRRQKNKTFLVTLLVAALLGGGLLFTIYQNKIEDELMESESIIGNLSSRASHLEKSLNLSEQEKLRHEHQYSTLKKIVDEQLPILISELQLGSANDTGAILATPGEMLFAEEMRYLKVHMRYIGMQSNEKIELSLRLYQPDGRMLHLSATDECTLKTSVPVKNGKTCDFVFPDIFSEWQIGNYRLEIWYQDRCLKSQFFTLHAI